MNFTTVPSTSRETSVLLRTYGALPFHTDGDLLALAFAPDGTLWSVEDTGVLRHWNLRGQQQIGWHHLEELASLWAFSPRARMVASGSDEVTVWDVATGDALMTWPQPDWVTALAWHPHLELLATGHDDHVVRVWDLRKQRAIHELRAHKSAISALTFSADGKKLASAGEERAIHLWDLATGAKCGSLTGHTDRIPALAWHPDGKYLVSAGWDTTARVWNVATCEPLILLNSHATQVQTLAFTPDGKLLACADSANAVHIWDMERKRTMIVLPARGNEIRCLAFSPDGQILASGGAERVIHVWDARSQTDEDSLVDPLLSRPALTVSADGKQLAALGAGTALRVWDTATGEDGLSLEGAGVLRAFAASPDGRWFAASVADDRPANALATLGIWDAKTGKRNRSLEGQMAPITALAFAADATLLASAGHQSSDVWLWQVASGEALLIIPNANDACSVEALAWHPQAKILACAGIDWLATGGNDGRVTLWDVSAHKPLLALPGGATSVTFHPAGKKLATATLKHTVCVWEIDNEQPLLELIGHLDAVRCVAYSPDGKILASGGDDHTIRFWDADSGSDRGVLELDSQVKALAFSPDGKYLYTGNGNTSCYQLAVSLVLCP
jgi:WD40 repeat protein